MAREMSERAWTKYWWLLLIVDRYLKRRMLLNTILVRASMRPPNSLGVICLQGILIRKGLVCHTASFDTGSVHRGALNLPHLYESATAVVERSTTSCCHNPGWAEDITPFKVPQVR
jgi:hypothetical protein